MENIMENDERLEKLAAVNTVEQLNQFMAETGFTLDEGVTAEQFLAAMKSEVSDELGEDDLDAVAGGVLITTGMLWTAARLGLPIAIYIARYVLGRR